MPKLCDYQNCRNRATYGVKRDCPIRCREHKDNMKLTSRICMCGKTQPSFNEPSETRPICCASCKTTTMINVTNKKCPCEKQPSFNEPSETRAICCASCKTTTMVNVINKKCKCGKIPCFNEPNETIPICCASCKTSTMVDVKSKLCK